MALLEQSIIDIPPVSFCSRASEFSRGSFKNYPKPLNAQPDFLLLDKSRRLLHLFQEGRIIKHSYTVALGGNPKGHKEREGDQKTPEGFYLIELKNQKSEFYLSLRLNYPNGLDHKRAKERGIKDPGKDVMIHGLPNSWVKRRFIKHPSDWTKGCAAVTNTEISDIFATVQLGTLIEICP